MRIKVFGQDKDGYIKIKVQELQKLINESYNEGYSDGSREDYYWRRTYSTFSLAEPYKPPQEITTPKKYPDNPVIITCNSNNEASSISVTADKSQSYTGSIPTK